jgi:hypothetical protein
MAPFDAIAPLLKGVLRFRNSTRAAGGGGRALRCDGPRGGIGLVNFEAFF